MVKTQTSSVQEVPIERAKSTGELLESALAVNIVARNRVTDGTQMDSNLVSTTRLDPNLEQREATQMFQDLVLRKCGTSFRLAGRHLRSNCRMAAHCQVDSRRLVRWSAVDQRQVSFLNFPALECGTEVGVSDIIFCYDQKAGRLFIEPVDNTGPALSADIR